MAQAIKELYPEVKIVGPVVKEGFTMISKYPSKISDDVYLLLKRKWKKLLIENFLSQDMKPQRRILWKVQNDELKQAVLKNIKDETFNNL